MAVVDLHHVQDQGNYYSDLVQGQNIACVSSFTLESGHTLYSVPVAFKTWGNLNQSGDNTLVLCHALSGSSDAEDWWRPMMGPSKTFDYEKYFVFCANILGSPYGSASPLTINPNTGAPYGPAFPETTIRDDVHIQKLVLDALGVKSIVAAIGGSMGGMEALEWPLCTPSGYVKSIIPITTSAYHSAWGIAWGESQRRCIYADSSYKDGRYTPLPSEQPIKGLGAARMVAMLTYRSHGSFEKRFHRRPAQTKSNSSVDEETGLLTPSQSPRSSAPDLTTRFATQKYLEYQASKFLNRFDANCYIHLINKMDTHDVSRGRLSSPPLPDESRPTAKDLEAAFRNVPPRALVISIDTDVLFRDDQQIQLAKTLPSAKFMNLESPDGHDGFLLEFETLGHFIKTHLQEEFPEFYGGDIQDSEIRMDTRADGIVKSVFGEAEPEF